MFGGEGDEMGEKLEVEPQYRSRGKELIDHLYANDWLNPDLSLDAIGNLAEFIGWAIQANTEISVKAITLMADYKKRTKEKDNG